MSPALGFSDSPLSRDGVDRLGISTYYEGLAKFICGCRTPMTIAVQGDWGSGKTSAMNLVERKVDDTGRVKTLFFNTWHYSQLGMGDHVILALMNELIEMIAPDSRELLERFRKLAWVTSQFAVKQSAGMIGMGGVVDGAFEVMRGTSGPTSTAQGVRTLRDEFETAVARYCEKHHVDRVVVFIDDLDRLQPVRAVELLEALKVFFDCSRCVFVLAIDFDVVLRGVEAKFGENINKSKARSFFDKIIQVPFSLPVGSYQADRFFRDEVEHSSFEIPDEQQEIFLKSALPSVGANPRALKRLLNSYELLTLMTPGIDEKEVPRTLMFSLLCGQIAFPDFYEELVAVSGDSERVESLLTSSPDDEGGLSECKISPEEEYRFLRYRSELLDLIAAAGDDDYDLDLLRRCLTITSVTANRDLNMDSSVEGMAWDDEDRRQRAAQVTSTEIRYVLGNFERAIDAALGHRPHCFAGTQGNSWTMYYTDDNKKVQSMGPRTRPKFAEIRYGKNNLSIRFGLGSKGRLDQESPSWQDLIRDVQTWCAQPNNTAVLREKDGLFPYEIAKIRNSEQADRVAEFLRHAYDLMTEKMGDKNAAS